ncbi:MAG: hypothetical protein K0Q73_4170 [Paenibacillus sp.]|nr:hypothetical protein [Paenibacillus sp.]
MFSTLTDQDLPWTAFAWMELLGINIDNVSVAKLITAHTMAIPCSRCVVISWLKMAPSKLEERIVPINLEVMNKPEAIPVSAADT